MIKLNVMFLTILFIKTIFKSDWFVGIGTTASIIGVMCTFYQSWKAKKISMTVQIEVDSVKQEMKKITDITDLTKMMGISDLAYNSVSRQSFETAIVHFRELKRFLIEYKSSLSLKELDNKMHQCISFLGSDINILSMSNINNNVIDTTSLLQHLELVNDLLSDWRGKIKKNEL